MRLSRRVVLLSGLIAAVVAGFAVARGILAPARLPGTPAGRPPAIRPDYCDVVVPPNLAPLNFVVEEPGQEFSVAVRGAVGPPLTVRSRSPRIRFPLRPWRRLLAANKSERLTISIAVREAGGAWRDFAPIENSVAREETDPYLVYRLITPIYNTFYRVGLHQRHLGSFDERLVLHGRYFAEGCTNCHSFAGGRTGTMSVGLRGTAYGNGTLVVGGGRTLKLDAMWGYTSWHPNGRVAAYSLNKVRQFFHSARCDQKDVVDLDSDVVIYTLGSDVVTTTPALADPDRLETYPTWSPDGRYLYYCSAPILWTDRNAVPPVHYAEVRYDLRRVEYDPRTERWGPAETVLLASGTGKSILLPRISPDGRFLLFCMCDYGCFPAYQSSSDLYIMDLGTRRYRRLDINSERSEAWHCWSRNGRWIVFSSKRQDGLFTRPYLSHVDEAGNASKPLVLPQADPALYDGQVETYSVPEFVQEPVHTAMRTFAAAARTTGAKLKMPEISMTKEQPGTKPAPENPWRGSPPH
jgi:hypothetical protein